jgi:hypothetical protein
MAAATLEEEEEGDDGDPANGCGDEKHCSNGLICR